MKQFITIALTAITFSAQAQITFEHSYSPVSNFQVVNLENEGRKYLLFDTLAQNIKIYNDNHTLFKTINTPMPSGSKLGSISCASENLFDNDAQIELAYSYYTLPSFIYTSIICKEDGTVIKTLNDVYYCNPIKMDNGWKIQAQKLSTLSNDIYSVPGQYLGMVKPGNNGNTETSIYPNPVSNAATIRYQLPGGVNSAQLQVYNMNGVLVRSYTVTNQFNDILLQAGELAPGQYVYKLSAPGMQDAAEKFIVQ